VTTDASQEFRRLAAMSRRELGDVHRSGETPDVAAVLGHEFRGFNHPWFMGLIGIRKFIKGFFPARGEAFGFNTPARQNGLDGVWLAKPDEANPKRYGFYSVEAGEAGGRHATAILLDYSRGDNGLPLKLLRDYVVRADPGSDELLLGKAYFEIGRVRIPFCFFLLERRRPFEPGPELEEHVRDD
jgi:hypothetical protein